MCFEQMSRLEEDMTDEEHLLRSTDEYWFTQMCIEQLHRLPSEVAETMGCSEYTHLQAYSLVHGMYQRLAHKVAQNKSNKVMSTVSTPD